MKKAGIVIAIVLVVLAGGLSIYYFTCMNPQRGTVNSFEQSMPLNTIFSAKEAMRDLDYVYNHVSSRHPAWLDGNMEAVNAFEKQYETEKELLSSQSEVSVLQIWQSCARLTAVMHDGHTGVYYQTDMPKFIDDVTQMNEYGLPIRINKIALEEIENNFLSICPYEVEEYALNRFAESFVNMDYWLAGSGVDILEGVTFTFDTPQGEQDFHYNFVDYNQIKGLEDILENTATDTGENAGTNHYGNEWVHYSIDEEDNIAIFTLTECTYNDEYRRVVDDFWKQVFEQDIVNVIVDLRGNGGGSSNVANYFLGYLDVDSMQSWDYAMRVGWYLYSQDNYVIQNPQKEQEFTESYMS